MVILPQTVEEFLSPTNLRRNVYLDGEPEFNHLYVRKGPRVIRFPDGSSREFGNVFQVARVEATNPRTGALRRLIERIDRFSECALPIYIENVGRPEVIEGLSKSSLGFVQVDGTEFDFAVCFFLMRP